MTVVVVDEQSDVAVDVTRLERLATFVLADQDVPEGMELNVLCVGDAHITELNEQHMGKEGPTDVLAFPLDDPDEAPEGLLGDVVLCPAIAADQAAGLGRTPDQEMDLLVVHGILHVLGHDHAEPEEEAVMFGLTDRLLADFAQLAGEVGR